MATERVLVALSGGVDSSVCVQLLLQEGYEVQAVVLDLSPAHAESVEAAQAAADALGIRLHRLSRHALFEEAVANPFAAAYRCGKTPNPCVVCNPAVKFRLLLEQADALGIGWVATGHYARVAWEDARCLIRRGACEARDQSYMLYRLTEEQRRRLLLPLGELDKTTVRSLAEQAGLPCAHKADSQEICFIPEGDYASYIEARYGPCPAGDFIGPDGTVAGRHRGLLHYTVGQRKGLGLALGRPAFVKRLDPAENRVYLGWSGEEFAPSVALRDPVTDGFPAGTFAAGAKIRSAAPIVPCQVEPTETGFLVRFAQPQRAPAPGQSCVLYDGDRVLGGGIIE